MSDAPAATSAQDKSTWRPQPLVTAFIVVAAGLLLWAAYHVFLLTFAAILLAIFLRAVSDWLAERTPLSSGWSLGFVAVGLLGLAAGVITLVAPRVGQQIDELRTRLPEILQNVADGLSQYKWTDWPFETGTDQLVGAGGAIFGQVLGVFQVTVTGLGYAFAFLLLGLYLAAEAERYRDGLIWLLPAHIEERARDVLNATAHTLRWWLLGQMVSMSVLGIVSFVGLTLFEIPLAFTLALFTALLTFIPTLGPAISVVPPLLLAIPLGPWTMFYVLVFWTIMQVSEGSFLTPMVQRQAISMPPALLLTMQILASAVIGFWGLVLAAPMTAAGMILTRRLFVEDVLGKSVPKTDVDQ